jgi:AcrR family transcriptional regulator
MLVTAPRSRLSAERQAQIFGAVIERLGAVGYEAMTMDAIAADAHTSKATLYRQWGGLPGLVVAAIEHRHPRQAGEVDTGSLRGDLVALMCEKHDQADEDSALLAALLRAVFIDEDVGAALREHILKPAFEQLDIIFARAIDRGETAPDCAALPYIGNLIASFGVTHTLLRERPATAADFMAVIDDVVIPLLVKTF